VFCGSGGVGKTSTAAAAALAAAVHDGGRVLVLTIDPARRLADALGIEGIGNVERRVSDDALRANGLHPRGELWAAMLDTKASWDDLVLRHAPDEETAYRILDNRLYANLTSRFVQSHDYIAMERFFDLHSTGKYDLIVVDTPPTRNALDFLDAPQRMADFFGGRLLRWLTMPYRLGGRRGARLVNLASRPFYQVADRLLGTQFLQDIAEFFLNFETMYSGFITRARAVERLMHDRRTSFVVVTTLEGAPLREAEFFCSELTARDFHLGAMVLNRVLPETLLDPGAAAVASRLVDATDDGAAPLAELGVPELSDPARVARVLRTAGGAFEDFAVVAAREAEMRAELARLPEVVVTVPTFTDDISDVAGLWQMSERLLEGAAR
jgi:anion-transporting  ArsA/GET3 family ATPase